MTEPANTILLVQCVRRALGTGSDEHVRTAINAGTDWNRVLRTARQHGVMPLVYRALAESAAAMPTTELGTLRAAYHANARRNLAATGELLRVLAALEAERIPAIPLKGPVLAVTLYGGIAWRQFADLDIVVPRRCIDGAAARLTEMGYVLSSSEETSISATGTTQDGRLTIDLQWALGEARHRFPMTPERLWEELESVEIGGSLVHHPRPGHHIVLLCSHPAKHCWSRLGWVADVAAFMRAHGDRLDWQAVLQAAKRTGGERQLLLGLGLARDVLGTPLPAIIRARLRNDRRVAALVGELCARLLASSGTMLRLNGSYGRIASGLLYMRTRERLRDRLPYAADMLRQLRHLGTLRPNDQDRAVVALPRYATPLYRLIRPARLAAKYGPRLMTQAFSIRARHVRR